jgi:chemotaxis protein methyltransferase CheR
MSVIQGGEAFELSDADFARARSLIRRFAGIVLGETKRALVYGRLVPLLRERKLSRVSEYLDLVEARADEREQFINALTTNVTDFFREKHHFEALRTRILPRLYRRGGPIRIWSAGCSSGEEPYSIALTVLANPPPSNCEVKILAADLDSQVVAKAAEGVYPLSRLEPVSPEHKQLGFLKGRGRFEGQARVRPEVQALIAFKQLNLMGPWPMKGLFDVIFCRNVLIYFDEPTRRTLVDRFVSQLQPGGALFLGHSESMMGVHPQLSNSGHTLFERRELERAA